MVLVVDIKRLVDSKYSWALNNSNMDYLVEMQKLNPFNTTIYDTIGSSGVYKLSATGDVKSVVERYRDLFYNEHNEKVIPPCILNSSIDVVKSFIDGYYMADGDKDSNGYVRMDCKGKEGVMGLYHIGSSFGIQYFTKYTQRQKTCIEANVD
jgi:intein/homing endonuclease